LSKITLAKANGKFQEQTDLQGIYTKHDPKRVGGGFNVFGTKQSYVGQEAKGLLGRERRDRRRRRQEDRTREERSPTACSAVSPSAVLEPFRKIRASVRNTHHWTRS